MQAFVESHDEIQVINLIVTPTYKSSVEDGCEVVINVTMDGGVNYYTARVHLGTDTVFGDEDDILQISTICNDGNHADDPVSVIVFQAHNDFNTYYKMI